MRLAVVGGAGRMGRWLVRHFVSLGHEVTVSDTRSEEARAFAEAAGVNWVRTNVEAVRGADAVVVSTPIEATPTVIGEVAPHVRRGSVVAEIASLKSRAVEALAEATRLGLRPLSVHPLFGPGARGLRGRRVAVVPVVDAEAEAALARVLFPGAEVVVVDAEGHDRAMALTLSLPHFINIIFASLVGDEDLAALKRLGGTTFQLQLTLAESIVAEDPALHASLQMDNEYAPGCLERFLSRARLAKGWVDRGERARLTALCNRVRGSLSRDEDFAGAYERMYKVLEALQK